MKKPTKPAVAPKPKPTQVPKPGGVTTDASNGPRRPL